MVAHILKYVYIYETSFNLQLFKSWIKSGQDVCDGVSACIDSRFHDKVINTSRT